MAADRGVNYVGGDAIWSEDDNVKFSIATVEEAAEIEEFMYKNYYPYEPIALNLDALSGDGWLDRYCRRSLDESPIHAALRCGKPMRGCIIARSVVDNRIVGSRLGAIYSRDECEKMETPKLFGNWITNLPSFLPIPPKIIKNVLFHQLCEDVKYIKSVAFRELEECGDLIYFDATLTVATEMRGKGLGKELVRRVCEIAKKAGCRYTYILATGKYSQRLFHQLGAQTIKEVQYDNYRRDKRGRPFLLDTGEHTKLECLAIDHNKLNV